MTILSPNMLKTYQTCPKLYKFRYIDKLNIPTSNTPFEKGKKIHALANYFLQGVNISRIETVLNENEKEIWQTLLDNPFFRKKHFQSEYQLSCKIDKFWIGGRLDAIVQDGENYYILDYKTGSTPKSPEYDYQTMPYANGSAPGYSAYNSQVAQKQISDGAAERCARDRRMETSGRDGNPAAAGAFLCDVRDKDAGRRVVSGRLPLRREHPRKISPGLPLRCKSLSGYAR